MYEKTPVWVKGRVVRFDHVNPHTLIMLEGSSQDGQVRRWAVEGPGQSQLDRMGMSMDVPKIGAVIEFCAFPYKSPDELSRMFPGVDFSARRASRGPDGSPQYVAGHVMVLPDGERRLWEPHGVMGECMRTSDDQRQSWLHFLNANARARQAWCEQRGYMQAQSNTSLRKFVEEINGLIEMPCR
jgi:hypothetical protein